MQRCDAEFYRFEIAEGRQAIVAVRMILHRNVTRISRTIGISFRARSGVSRPPTSLKQIR